MAEHTEAVNGVRRDVGVIAATEQVTLAGEMEFHLTIENVEAFVRFLVLVERETGLGAAGERIAASRRPPVSSGRARRVARMGPAR